MADRLTPFSISLQAGQLFGMKDILSGRGKVAICTPTLHEPVQAYRDSLAASIQPLLDRGYAVHTILEKRNQYISLARANLVRKAQDVGATIIVFIDDDVSWQPEALIKLVETEGDVVGGVYRYKTEKMEGYMCSLLAPIGESPVAREDGALPALFLPAGFLKVTKAAIDKMSAFYPQLVFGSKDYPYVDLFNHGAFEGRWYGEDIAFCRNWVNTGGSIWLVPDLDLDHTAADGTVYHGNFQNFLNRNQ